MQSLQQFCCGCFNYVGASDESYEVGFYNGGEFSFYASGKSIQHPLKMAARTSINADAFLFDEHMLGVADGVSSVELEGYDPSLLPKELLQRCSMGFSSRSMNTLKYDSESKSILSACEVAMEPDGFLLHILSRAAADCTSKGSTTCLLVILEFGELWTVSIGDSYMIQLRRSDDPPRPAATDKEKWEREEGRRKKKMKRENGRGREKDGKEKWKKEGSAIGEVENTESGDESKGTSYLRSKSEPVRLKKDLYYGNRIAAASEERNVRGNSGDDESENDKSSFSSSSSIRYDQKSMGGIRPLTGDRHRRSRQSDSNLGGYIIIHRTIPQQHFFNCPFQVTRMPDIDCSYCELIRRTAAAAESTHQTVAVGDVIVLGTDGVFDNLFDEDIVEIINDLCWNCSSPGKVPTRHPKEVVDKLIQTAIKMAYPPVEGQPNRPTPFSESALIELGRVLKGGKPDDTTVVVAYVTGPTFEPIFSSSS